MAEKVVKVIGTIDNIDSLMNAKIATLNIASGGFTIPTITLIGNGKVLAIIRYPEA